MYPLPIGLALVDMLVEHHERQATGQTRRERTARARERRRLRLGFRRRAVA